MLEVMDMREVNYLTAFAARRSGQECTAPHYPIVPAPDLNLTLHHGRGWSRLAWIAGCCNRQEDHQGRQASEDDHSAHQIRRCAEDLRWVVWSAPLRDEL